MKQAVHTTRNWYALYVNARHEKKIGLKMKEAGIECYVPLITRISQWSDRKKKVEVPLISGYIFVYVNALEMSNPKYISGVLNYVHLQGKPAVIREKEIEGLRYFVEKGFVFENADDDDLKIGDRVGFRLAEFKSLTAVVENLASDNYAIVSFDGLAMNFRLRVSIQTLRKPINK